MTFRQLDVLTKRYVAKNEREDFRSAQICALFANAHRDEKEKPEPFTPLDFMPGKAKPKKQQTEQEMLAVARVVNAAFGGVEV